MRHPEVRQPERRRINRCGRCRQFVGERFTGYTADKTSKREPLLCEPCVKRRLLEGAP